jgi:hypothetical protein
MDGRTSDLHPVKSTLVGGYPVRPEVIVLPKYRILLTTAGDVACGER